MVRQLRIEILRPKHNWELEASERTKRLKIKSSRQKTIINEQHKFKTLRIELQRWYTNYEYLYKLLECRLQVLQPPLIKNYFMEITNFQAQNPFPIAKKKLNQSTLKILIDYTSKFCKILLDFEASKK